MFSFLFGKKKQSISPTKTIDKLRETLNMLEKREVFLEKEISSLKEQATKYLQDKNKTKALNSLKKSKLLEKELESISGQKLNLDIQISSLTQAVTNSETLNAMRIGKETLSALEIKNDPDKVADTIDEISDHMAKLDEITETISRPIKIMDEDELLDELNELSKQKEQDLESLPSSWPQVPMKEIKSKTDEELKELSDIMLI